MKPLQLGKSNVPSASANVGLSSIAPIVLPHSEQKALLEYSDERHNFDEPPEPVHCICSFDNSTQT
ncbi:hypothetical protein KAN5_08320 [Pseudoalteromonas sp. KAN5]|nr:hypothetical protein KAN5_08320 [Pseudoalteromonas sp. KAN5]